MGSKICKTYLFCHPYLYMYTVTPPPPLPPCPPFLVIITSEGSAMSLLSQYQSFYQCHILYGKLLVIPLQRWYFSTSFSAVEKWVHSDSPFMAAHLEECKYFDRWVPSADFSYCFIVQPNGPEGSSSSNGGNSEIGLEFDPGHEDSEVDQIGLECKMSDENTTDTETETSTSDSESDLADAEDLIQ